MLLDGQRGGRNPSLPALPAPPALQPPSGAPPAITDAFVLSMFNDALERYLKEQEQAGTPAGQDAPMEARFEEEPPQPENA
jgi:hypothetical protein